MSRLPKVLTALAAGLLLAACTDNGPTNPGSIDRAGVIAASNAHTMVPITWKYHVTAVPGTETLTCPNSDGSPPFISIGVHWLTEGTVTHLGLLDAQASTAEFTACQIDIVGGYPVSGTGDVSGILMGANGDALFINGVLTLSLVTGDATGQWTITGGTGRFEGASGWFETFETPSPSGDGSIGSGSGMITPPGMLAH